MTSVDASCSLAMIKIDNDNDKRAIREPRLPPELDSSRGRAIQSVFVITVHAL